MNSKDTEKKNISRAPIIAIMGHIDHGKSKLLDYIRKTNIVDSEAGGITQHLSAYEVTYKDKKITFLDTPGHAAFSAMRFRGVTIADIAILIVSAEEGVKTQTKEALKTIKESGIPYIVAINKIDKPEANVEKTKQNLSENEVYLEGYGGDIPYVPISAKDGQGVNDLLDMMILVAEMEELKGDLNKPAEGIIIESHLDPKQGICATLIIKDGALKKGGFIVAQDCISPLRKVEDFLGNKIDEASFSSPIKISGFNKIPKVGSIFHFTETKKGAEKIAKNYEKIIDISQEEIKDDSETTIVPIIIKTDVLGTLEAIENEIKKIKIDGIFLKIISSGVGAIGETDVKMASAAQNPIIIGFHTKLEPKARELADRTNIEIKIFDIIYKITEWLEEELEKRRPRATVEEVIGRAKIMKVFSQQKNKQVLGGKVKEGSLKVGGEIKIIRRENEIGKGKIIELQQQKVLAQEVRAGNEFGTRIESKIDLAPGDIVEAFILTEK